MGNPDMRTSIAYGLAWPDRINAGVAPLDLIDLARLDFEAPDTDAFPCLRLAQEAIAVPGGMCVLNAANEIAVAAFLAADIKFTDIDQVIEKVLDTVTASEPQSVSAVEALDNSARQAAIDIVARLRCA